jgi:UDP-N-acetylmuramoylalanine--D-glutamate ligase
MLQLKGKRALVLGKGVSGLGAMEALEKCGALVKLCDETDFVDAIKNDYDIAVISPSITLKHQIFSWAQSKGIEVIGEIELGSRLCDKPFVSVTGTNGKTTTVELLGEMLTSKKVCVTGNIGRSFALDAIENYGCFVVETSSFQLESIKNFKPKVAVITNISPDHLDRHESLHNYAKTKFRIFENQDESDYAIMSADDIPCELVEDIKPRSEVFFISTKKPVRGAYLLGDKLYLLGKPLCRVRDVALNGKHNIKNALTASLAAKLMGASDEEIKRALSSFKTSKHRLKYLTSVRGVAFYDDSKGTNVAATLAAMESMPSSFCVILGGSDKGYEYDELFKNAPRTLIKVCICGDTAKKIFEAAERNNFHNLIECETMCQAVMEAYKSGADNVLLSPASASFDRYSSYKERGEDFARIVSEIKDIEKRG